MTAPQSLQRLVLAAGLVFCASSFSAVLGSTEVKAEKDRIAADYKTAKTACNQQAGNAKDICVEQAKGNEKVAFADLQYRTTGVATDGIKLAVARGDAAYAIAKERCDDKAGNDKDVCRKEAKAEHVKATADAKLAKVTSEARHEASTDKSDANYKVAIEKCDALAGAPKDSCVASAKAQFGKT